MELGQEAAAEAPGRLGTARGRWVGGVQYTESSGGTRAVALEENSAAGWVAA